MRCPRRMRAGWLGAGGAAVLAGVVVYACASTDGLNDPAPDSGSVVDSAAGDSGSTGDSDASTDAPTVPDADAGGPVSEGGCADPCDCDGDLYKNGNPGCSGTPVDCNDYDSRVRPNQAFLDQTPPAGAPKPGDWDCNGTVDKLFKVNAVCSGAANGPCNTQSGFAGDPPCGTSATFILCGDVGIGLCEQKSTEMRKQACR